MGIKTNLKDRLPELVIRLIGALLFLGGIISFILGPIEIYSYSLFTNGGRFYYEGFGFGSLMFGIITIQVIGYYAIALIAIPLGWGHIRLQQWVQKICLTFICDWFIIGLPLTIIAFLMFLTSKDISISSIPVLILAFILLYPVSPILAYWFYQSNRASDALKRNSISAAWIDKPLLILVASSLMIFFSVGSHLPLLFNGIFPFFNHFITGLEGYIVIGICILLFAFLAWGIYQQSLLSWYGSILFLSFLIASSASAFLQVSPLEIFSILDFAEIEYNAVNNIPLQGYMFALFFSLPLVICLVLILSSRKHHAPFRSNV
jgi:hypothetical protein